METRPKDNIDILIENLIHEDMEQIDISDEEIEMEWHKLQHTLNHRKTSKKKTYKKVAAIAASTIICLGLISVITDHSIIARRTNTTTSTIEQHEEKTVIRSSSSMNQEQTNPGVDDTDNTMIMSIEDAREFVNFHFKELPFTLENAVITAPGEDIYIVELNYINEKGKIRLSQFLEGIESKRAIGIPKDSTVETFVLNNIECLFIKIGQIKGKTLWSSQGISFSLDVKYDISKEEMIEMIKTIK
ncbi:MAG: DUF4367 domain-containing protein [Bacillota bacterium]